ncbi:glutathione S-transferase [Phlebopus sp. FC_14]|nr:glutathione S-transferase [Phlebopus sp. FC_14]
MSPWVANNQTPLGRRLGCWSLNPTARRSSSARRDRAGHGSEKLSARELVNSIFRISPPQLRNRSTERSADKPTEFHLHSITSEAPCVVFKSFREWQWSISYPPQLQGSAMLTIHGFWRSSCTKRVALILHEKAVPFKLVEVPLGTFKSPEHLKKQPFGQIPVLDDEGYVLYGQHLSGQHDRPLDSLSSTESRAIVRYINAKYAAQGTTGLAPSTSDVHALGKFEMTCSIEYSQFSPVVDRLMKEVIFKKAQGLTVDETVEKTLKTILEQKLDVYDQILAKQRYLAGENVTLADLFHVPECDLIFKYAPDIVQSRIHVGKWWQEISSRKSWLAVKDGVKSVEVAENA